MDRIIYIDFDGVLVDTTIYIRQSLEKVENNIEILKTLPWNKMLNICCEINNNISIIKKLSEKTNVVILTHVYSEFEEIEKKKYIYENISGIEVIAVPYYINKNDAVDAKNNILIDDYKHNITKWNEAGGIGIHFNTTQIKG